MKYSKQQNVIFKHRDNHALISAGPGSGKTTTLNQYIIELLSDGLTDKDLLVLMFNKSAQQDFLKKLQKKSDGLGFQLPEIRTFHSISFSIIKMLEDKGIMPKMELNSSQKFMELLAMNACEKVLGRNGLKEVQLSLIHI